MTLGAVIVLACLATTLAKPSFLAEFDKNLKGDLQKILGELESELGVDEDKAINHEGEDFAQVRLLQTSAFTDKDSSSFPDIMPVQVQTSTGKLNMFLQRNRNIRLDKVKITVGEDDDGDDDKEVKMNWEDTAFYQDRENGAVITVRSENNRRLFEGTLVAGNKHYELKHISNSGLKDRHLDHKFGPGVEFNDLHAVKKVDLDITYETSKGSSMARAFMGKGESNDELLNKADNVPVMNPVEVDVDGNGEASRKKRTIDKTNTDFHVELMFVTDHTIYEYWLKKSNNNAALATKKLASYFAGIFNGIHLTYGSISSYYDTLKITPWLKEIYICKTSTCSSFTKDSVTAKVIRPSSPKDYNLNTKKFFEKFNKWRYDKGYSWYNPDHMMVWTEYDINGDATIGMAPVGGICKGGGTYMNGQSINEDIGLHAWNVASHELGHNLGSPHDTGGACANDYIMAPQGSALDSARVDKLHTFSECSVKSFLNTLSGTADKFPRACLHDTVCENGHPVSEDDQLPGAAYSLTDQCEFAFGEGHIAKDSGFCASDEVCLKLKCYDTKTRKCRWGAARGAEGTPCGPNKWCRRGHCVTKSTTSNTNPASCTITTHNIPPDCSDKAGFTFPVKVGDVLLSLTCKDITTKFPEFCFLYGSILASCGHSCFGAGLSYDDSSCSGGSNSCSDTPGVTFTSSKLTCSQVATKGWCVYDVVTTNCCGSCA